MSTFTKTQDLSLTGINGLISDLENARAAYDGEEEAAFAASMIFTWFGLIGGPAGVCVTAGVLTGVLAYYFDTVQNSITSAIAALEDYKDILQSNSNYNMVRMEVTYDTQNVNNVSYIIPTDFTGVAVHSINPSGWLYI